MTPREDLRQQTASAIAIADGYNPNADPTRWELDRDSYLRQADAVVEVVLTTAIEAIEALPWEFCSQDDYARLLAALEALREES
jgi:hypothetical protein